MKLYKVVFRHYSQKDSEEGIKGFVIAENDEQMFEHVDTEHTYGSWEEKDSEDEHDPEDYEEADATYKARMIRLGGEYYDQDHEVENLYYGATEWGWELVSDITKEQEATLIALGVAINCKIK